MKAPKKSETEDSLIQDVIVKMFNSKSGKNKVFDSNELINAIKSKTKMVVGGARVRRVINNIRTSNAIPNLIASSKGYYIEPSKILLRRYVASLRERANAINSVANALEKNMRKKV